MITPILIPLAGSDEPMPWWGWLIVGPALAVLVVLLVWLLWTIFEDFR